MRLYCMRALVIRALSEPLHLTKGDSLIVKYAIIRDLVLDKSVCLS